MDEEQVKPADPDNHHDHQQQETEAVTPNNTAETLDHQVQAQGPATGTSSSTSTKRKASSGPGPSEEVVVISDTESDGDSDICHIDSYQATAAEAKRIRTGYYSTGSSDESSDGELESEDTSSIIETPSSNLSQISKLLHPRMDIVSEITLNEKFNNDSVKNSLKERWLKKERYSDAVVDLDSDPFRVCVINEFLNEADIINNIIDNMNTLDWSRKTMDLYEFHRTDDLSSLTWQRGIKAMYELLKGDAMKWVSEVTGLTLTHISASCALYGPGDHLLVHDDLMSDRKVAFIFYLTPWDISYNNYGSNMFHLDSENNEEENCKLEKGNKTNGWATSMGGILQCFATDDCGKPTIPVKSIIPHNNSFVFFKVGKETFHKVTEVTTFDYPRLTINGWFHGPVEEVVDEINDKIANNITPYKQLGTPPNTDVVQATLAQWINSNYLSPRTKNNVQEQMENSSEVCLADFFIFSQYQKVVECLKSESDPLPWKPWGPANLRQFEMLEVEKLSQENIIIQLQKLLSTDHFLRLLGDLTGLTLKTFHRLEIQKWTAGSYTVLPPKEEFDVTELDVIMYFGLPSRHFSGGSFVYLVPEEEHSDPLITVEPTYNSLNIVYSDDGTSKFTKYVRELSLSKDEYFYIVVCSYRE